MLADVVSFVERVSGGCGIQRPAADPMLKAACACRRRREEASLPSPTFSQARGTAALAAVARLIRVKNSV